MIANLYLSYLKNLSGSNQVIKFKYINIVGDSCTNLHLFVYASVFELLVEVDHWVKSSFSFMCSRPP